MYEFYKSLLLLDFPKFLKKYLNCPSLLRLKKIGYFCGMDYASKDIYDFGEYISRYDHSIDVALLTWRLTRDKRATIAGLFHDVATPCFAHVIDYMNKDYATQESTEAYTGKTISSDKKLLNNLKKDHIDVNDIIDFKKYSIVDNHRPKLCADRLDGVILTGLFWTKNVTKRNIPSILKHLVLVKNEDNELELGFNNLRIAKKVLEVSQSIDVACHTNEDNFMMELLANLTRYLLDKKYLKYEDLFVLHEDDIHKMFSKIDDESFKKQYLLFKTIKKEDVPHQELLDVKSRKLHLLVNGKRIID